MMAVIGIVAYQTIKDKLPLILTFYNIPLYTAIAAVGNILVDMGIRVSAVFLIIGFADLIFQRHKFKTDNMMTKQEVKDEFKNSEGDPQVKGQVKRRMMEISRRRMMEALPEADVVITNPTHFAVALKYEPNSGKAPVVIAKVRIIWPSRLRIRQKNIILKLWKINRLRESFITMSILAWRFHRNYIRL